jgi:hypothetical protein
MHYGGSTECDSAMRLPGVARLRFGRTAGSFREPTVLQYSLTTAAQVAIMSGRVLRIGLPAVRYCASRCANAVWLEAVCITMLSHVTVVSGHF